MTVAVDGSTAQFNGSATWNLKAPKDTTAAVTITNSAGQTVYSGNFPLRQGNASFVWDGKGNDGTQWPAGSYKLTATAKDSSGKDVAIPTEIQGVVDSVDLTANPALLSIGGQNYTTDQIRRVMRPATTTSPRPGALCRALTSSARHPPPKRTSCETGPVFLNACAWRVFGTIQVVTWAVAGNVAAASSCWKWLIGT